MIEELSTNFTTETSVTFDLKLKLYVTFNECKD